MAAWPSARRFRSRRTSFSKTTLIPRTSASKEFTLASKEATLVSREFTFSSREATLVSREFTFSSREATFVSREVTLVSREFTFSSKEATLVSREFTLASKEATLVSREFTFSSREVTLASREFTFSSREVIFVSRTVNFSWTGSRACFMSSSISFSVMLHHLSENRFRHLGIFAQSLQHLVSRWFPNGSSNPAESSYPRSRMTLM